jgi:hypothetical protein
MVWALSAVRSGIFESCYSFEGDVKWGSCHLWCEACMLLILVDFAYIHSPMYFSVSLEIKETTHIS